MHRRRFRQRRIDRMSAKPGNVDGNVEDAAFHHADEFVLRVGM